MSRAIFIGACGGGRPSMQAIVERLANEGVISFADESMTISLDTETSISEETFDQLKELIQGQEESTKVIVIDSLADLSAISNRMILSAGPAPVDGQTLSQTLNMYAETRLQAPSTKRNKQQKSWQHWQDRKRRS